MQIYHMQCAKVSLCRYEFHPKRCFIWIDVEHGCYMHMYVLCVCVCVSWRDGEQDWEAAGGSGGRCRARGEDGRQPGEELLLSSGAQRAWQPPVPLQEVPGGRHLLQQSYRECVCGLVGGVQSDIRIDNRWWTECVSGQVKFLCDYSGKVVASVIG